MSTAFHPQMDGATERANRSIAQILCKVVSNNQSDWSDKCPMVEFTINSSINTTTGYAPFELNYGYMPRSGQHISTDTTFKGVKQCWHSNLGHVSLIQLEWSKSGCCADATVQHNFYHWAFGCPIPLIIMDDHPQNFPYSMVCLLCCVGCIYAS